MDGLWRCRAAVLREAKPHRAPARAADAQPVAMGVGVAVPPAPA